MRYVGSWRCQNPATLIGLRDRALLTALALQGFRISEALGICVEHLDHELGHRVAEIRGKGDKLCRVPLSAATWDAMSTWTTAAGITSGPIFVGVTKAGKVEIGTAISSQSAWKRVRKLARQAGIEKAMHPHLFRHAAITAALGAGVPLHQVQDFGRHADPRTTRRYDSHRQSLSNPTTHVLAGLMCSTEATEPER